MNCELKKGKGLKNIRIEDITKNSTYFDHQDDKSLIYYLVTSESVQCQNYLKELLQELPSQDLNKFQETPNTDIGTNELDDEEKLWILELMKKYSVIKYYNEEKARRDENLKQEKNAEEAKQDALALSLIHISEPTRPY